MTYRAIALDAGATAPCSGPTSPQRSSIELLKNGSVGRHVCAGVLLVASVLKTYELATDPSLGVLHGSRWLYVALVQIEVSLALWLWSGLWPVAGRRVGLATFTSFAGVSLYLGLTSAASCGCFGRMQVSPWLTAGLDVVLTLLLWAWSPQHPVYRAQAELRPRLVAVASLLGLIVVAVPALSFVRPYQLTEHAAGLSLYDGMIVLEPEKWVGHRFPLARHIDIGPDIAHGSWRVVLYHHDCSRCQAVLPSYEQVARDSLGVPNSGRIALVEVPPYSETQRMHEQLCEHGRLSDDNEWFVTTPAELVLLDGQVLEARVGDDVASAFERHGGDLYRLGSTDHP